jgi:pimeloyl-ACP methyl ester carboxylesterase
VRRDAARLLRGARRSDLLRAAERLRNFDRPALMAWAREDRLFPVEHAHRLAAILPQGRVEEIADSWTFVSEDQPQETARLIAEFVRATYTEPAAAPATGAGSHSAG